MIIILNNKNTFLYEDYTKYLENLSTLNTNHTLILCPSYPYLSIRHNHNFFIGSQDVSAYDNFTVTGEITARQLKSLDVSYAIVGHCERRKINHEDSLIINKKILNLLAQDIIPILCIGENQNEYENKLTTDVITTQIKEALINLRPEEKEKVIIAYEPVWAVETNTIPDCAYIQSQINLIKNVLPNNQCIYGGGLNIDNYLPVANLANLDGLFLGKAGNDTEILTKIINNLSQKSLD